MESIHRRRPRSWCDERVDAVSRAVAAVFAAPAAKPPAKADAANGSGSALISVRSFQAEPNGCPTVGASFVQFCWTIQSHP